MQPVCQLYFVMFCSDTWKQWFCLWVCTHMYVFWALIPSCPIIHPNTGTKDNVPRHLSTADVISFLKEVRKTLLQKSRSWYSIVVAPQLLSESHLQYCLQMGLTGLEYSWILPVKWQSRNKIKTTHFSPHIFFRATVWGFFRNIKLPQCCGFFQRSYIRTKTPACTVPPLPSIWFPRLLLDIWKCLLKL